MCDNACQNSVHHRQDCVLLQKRKKGALETIVKKHFQIFYRIISIIRCLSLKQLNPHLFEKCMQLQSVPLKRNR